jgi:hypothetical protein
VRDDGIAAFGYLHVLPVRHVAAGHRAGNEPRMHYSFLSLQRPSREESAGFRLVAGEYRRHGSPTRLVGYDLDAAGLLTTDATGAARPAWVHDLGLHRMQGAVVVDGVVHATTSNGRGRRGHLWVGPPGALRAHRRVIPPGPEDLSYDPVTDRLWTLTEHRPGRFVLTLDRARFDG